MYALLPTHDQHDDFLDKIKKQFQKQKFKPLVSHQDARRFLKKILPDADGKFADLAAWTGCHPNNLSVWDANESMRLPDGLRVIQFLNTVATHPEPEKLTPVPPDSIVWVALHDRPRLRSIPSAIFVPAGATVETFRNLIVEQKLFGLKSTVMIDHFTLHGARLDEKVVWPSEIKYDAKTDVVLIHPPTEEQMMHSLLQLIRQQLQGKQLADHTEARRFLGDLMVMTRREWKDVQKYLTQWTGCHPSHLSLWFRNEHLRLADGYRVIRCLNTLASNPHFVPVADPDPIIRVALARTSFVTYDLILPPATTVKDFRTLLVEEKVFGIESVDEISHFTLGWDNLDETVIWPGKWTYNPKTDVVLIHTISTQRMFQPVQRTSDERKKAFEVTQAKKTQ